MQFIWNIYIFFFLVSLRWLIYHKLKIKMYPCWGENWNLSNTLNDIEFPILQFCLHYNYSLFLVPLETKIWDFIILESDQTRERACRFWCCCSKSSSSNDYLIIALSSYCCLLWLHSHNPHSLVTELTLSGGLYCILFYLLFILFITITSDSGWFTMA